MKNRALAVLMLVAAAICQAPSADAAAILYLDDGVTPTIIGDNQSGDVNTAVGAITYIGGLGDWSLNVSTGVSKPILGSASFPVMDLNSINIGFGTLKIALLDDGFSTADRYFRSTIDGNTFDSIGMISAIAGVAGSASQPFELNSIHYFDAFFGPGSFSGTGIGNAALTPSDLLFLGVTITSFDPSTTSFDFHTAAQVPEPGTLALLASGLLGFAVFGRRHIRK
ncbi:MAG TPA: PEP-CTERM sorting domain-containing protein [Candidatus Deferrimicrobiaceae bacterium]